VLFRSCGDGYGIWKEFGCFFLGYFANISHGNKYLFIDVTKIKLVSKKVLIHSAENTLTFLTKPKTFE
jgi:hypothetical protein